MSAYQSNVKVEPPCVARSARTPGSIVSSSTTFGNAGVAPAPHSSALRARPYGTGSSLPGKGTMFGNEQPKVARDMLVQGAAFGRWVINSDITRRQPVISELIARVGYSGVLNGNVSTTIISKKKMTIISKKNDNEIKIC